jgi:hypothetical protein
MEWVESGIEIPAGGDSPALAPLQQVMLRDSLSAPEAGHHVEQVEIRFTSGVDAARILAAWADTVARTEALRVEFVIGHGAPRSWKLSGAVNPVNLQECVPESWEGWLENDRCRPLLRPGAVPWRAVFWPDDRRFIWTFHHALLDGRSIARVLREFMNRADGGDARPLAVSRWIEPNSRALELAERMFLENPVYPWPVQLPVENDSDGPAVWNAGNDFAARLDSLAAAGVTAATVLKWAWGQTLTQAAGVDAVLVEQLRAGAPQEGTAGFTMNTLPVVIRRAADGDAAQCLIAFRNQLLELREIESVSPEDFPPGVYPDMEVPSASVIMVERGTLLHQIGRAELVESLVLHEARGETLMATAYLLPELRLEVEGPGRHQLLERWIRVLESLQLA